MPTMQEQGMPEVGALAQQRPEGAAEHATRTCPSGPTGSAVAAPGAVPVTRVPLLVIQAVGITVGGREVQQSPEGAAAHATRS